MPLVSVVIAAHNAAPYVASTLASACAQTYRALEVVVVNDGSTDSTADVVCGFAEADSRIRLLCQENKGVASARNLGIEAARGAFIAPLDADDVWYADKIARQLEVMLADRRFAAF